VSQPIRTTWELCRSAGPPGLAGRVETVSYERPGNMILTQGAEVAETYSSIYHLSSVAACNIPGAAPRDAGHQPPC